MIALAALALAASTWLQAAAGDSLLVLDPVLWPEAAPGEAYISSVGPVEVLEPPDPVLPGVELQRALRLTLFRFRDHRWLRLEECTSRFKDSDHGKPCLSLDFYDLAYRAPGAATFRPGSVRWIDARTFELIDDHPWTDAAGDARPGPRVLRMRYLAEGRVVFTAR